MPKRYTHVYQYTLIQQLWQNGCGLINLEIVMSLVNDHTLIYCFFDSTSLYTTSFF